MLPMVAIAVGMALGYATGGSVRSIPSPSPRQAAVLMVAYVAQVLVRGVFGAGHAIWWAWSAIGATLAVLLWMTATMSGMRLASAGVALNAIVVLLNGGMPVAAALGSRGGAGIQRFYMLNSRGAAAPVLADVIPLRALGQTIMLSPGDVLLAVGVCAYIYNGMHDMIRIRQKDSA